MIVSSVEAPLELSAQVIDLIGITILLIAALKFVVQYIRFEYGRVRGTEDACHIQDLRLQLGSYILLALEFMILSDIIHSALSRTLDDFILLGVLVAIRTVLSFFLGLDLKDAQPAKT